MRSSGLFIYTSLDTDAEVIELCPDGALLIFTSSLLPILSPDGAYMIFPFFMLPI